MFRVSVDTRIFDLLKIENRTLVTTHSTVTKIKNDVSNYQLSNNLVEYYLSLYNDKYSSDYHYFCFSYSSRMNIFFSKYILNRVRE